jgi:hypothetical protein
MPAAVMAPQPLGIFSLPDLELDASRNILPALDNIEPSLVLPQLDERSAGVDPMMKGLEDGLWWSRLSSDSVDERRADSTGKGKERAPATDDPVESGVRLDSLWEQAGESLEPTWTFKVSLVAASARVSSPLTRNSPYEAGTTAAMTPSTHVPAPQRSGH